MGPKIAFWHTKSYFYIRTGAENRILTFEILFWHSNWGRISYFDIRNPILTFEMGQKIVFWHSKSPFLTFELGPNIVFWHSKSYFDIQNGPENRILTFKILFWHSNCGRISYFDIQNSIFDIRNGPPPPRKIVFWHTKSCFDIRTGAEYRILTFEIPILTFPNPSHS